MFDERVFKRLLVILRSEDPLTASASALMLAATIFVELEDGLTEFLDLAKTAFGKAAEAKTKRAS